MGGVPITHDLTDSIKREDEKGDAFSALAKQFSVEEATVIRRTETAGTIAAQRGRQEFKHLQFRDENTARKFIDYILEHRTQALGTMIGFILDRPINLIGTSGWSVLSEMIEGKK